MNDDRYWQQRIKPGDSYNPRGYKPASSYNNYAAHRLTEALAATRKPEEMKIASLITCDVCHDSYAYTGFAYDLLDSDKPRLCGRCGRSDEQM